jgi:hypothetical protein
MTEPETLNFALNPEEYRIVLAGLGELPAKISRKLYNRLESEVQSALETRAKHADPG